MLHNAVRCPYRLLFFFSTGNHSDGVMESGGITWGNQHLPLRSPANPWSHLSPAPLFLFPCIYLFLPVCFTPGISAFAFVLPAFILQVDTYVKINPFFEFCVTNIIVTFICLRSQNAA